MTPPKYPRTFHLPFSPEVHADDKVHQDAAFLVDRDVVITEKLDGGNYCLWRGATYARSTGQETVHPSFSFIKAKHASKTLNEDYCFYGENLQAVRSIEYDGLEDFFWLFAVREGSTWLGWEEIEEVSAVLEFHMVPVLYRGTFSALDAIQEWMDSNIGEPIALGPTREGFVIRTVAAFEDRDFQLHTAKYVRRGHVQSEQHWSKNWVQAKLTESN